MMNGEVVRQLVLGGAVIGLIVPVKWAPLVFRLILILDFRCLEIRAQESNSKNQMLNSPAPWPRLTVGK
jgi:hypothetical protein